MRSVLKAVPLVGQLILFFCCCVPLLTTYLWLLFDPMASTDTLDVALSGSYSNNMYIVICVIACVLVALAFIRQLRAKGGRPGWCTTSAALLIVWAMVHHADYRTVLLFIPWTYFFLTALPEVSARQSIFWCLTGCLTVYIFLTFWSYFATSQYITPGFGVRASGFMSVPNIVYCMCLISYGVFIECSRYQSVRVVRYTCLFVALMSCILIVLTFSRGGWLALAAMIAYSIPRINFKLRPIALLAVALLVVGSLLVRTHGDLVLPQNDKSSAGRIYIWKDALSLVKDEPIEGYGYGAYFKLRLRGIDDTSSLPSNLPLEPKSLYLDIMLDWGVVGVALVGCFFYGILKGVSEVAMRVGADSFEKTLAYAAGSTLVGLAIAGLFDTLILGVFSRASVTVTFLILTGLLEGQYSDRPRAIVNGK